MEVAERVGREECWFNTAARMTSETLFADASMPKSFSRGVTPFLYRKRSAVKVLVL